MRTKATISEALSPYAKPTDCVMILQAIANDVDALAGRVGSTDLEWWQLAKPLGLHTRAEVMSLRGKGLNVRTFGERTLIDTRDYRRWTEAMCAEQSRRTWREPRQTQSMRQLF